MPPNDSDSRNKLSRRKLGTSVVGFALASGVLSRGVVGEDASDPTDFDPDSRKEVIEFIEAHDESDNPDALEEKLNKKQEEAVIEVLLNPEWEIETVTPEDSSVSRQSGFENAESIHIARATLAGNVRYRFEQTVQWEFNLDTWRNATTSQDGNGDSFTLYEGEVSSQIRNKEDDRFDARERAQFSLNIGTSWRTVTATITQRCEDNGNAELINEDTPL